ncbi:MAG: heavy metal translocating P-type ATPase [Thermoplasmatota archaeon]
MTAAPTETHTLRVTGMTCASCVATIEKALRATPGVETAVVNLATGKAQVHGKPDLTRQALAEAIRGSGYGVNESTAQADEGHDPRETRRLIAAIVLTIPLVFVAMGPHVLALFGGGMAGMDMGGADDMSGMQGMEGMEGMTAEEMAAMEGMGGMDMGNEPEAMATPYPWLQFALATPVVIIGGAPFFRGAWNAFRNRHLTMDVLVATGMVTAFGYSTAVLLFPALDSGQGVYFETAAVIVALLLLGRRIEQGAQRRARSTLRRLTDSGSDAGHMLEDAQSSKISVQHSVDRVVRYFVPAVLAIALAASVFWMTLGAHIATDAGFTPSSMALMSLIAVLIIACPCALGLAVPMAVLAGTSRGAEQGILFRNGQAVQATHGIDTVVLTKTGAVTVGHPEVTDVVSYGYLDSEILALAGAVEADGKHPLAIAIHRRAGNVGTALQASGFQELAGRGAQAILNGDLVRVGRLEWLAEQGIDVSAAKADAKRLRATGKTVVGVARTDRLLGVVAAIDPIRPTSRRAVEALQARGLEVVLMSGDSPDTANAIGSQLGITRTLSRVLPERQASTIQALKAEGRRVAVVGDGAQDGGAMAEAHLGIAVGGGTGAAGIVLTNEDLSTIPAALDLGKATMRKVHQNLAWAFGYNALLIPVAAGLLVAWQIFGTPMRLDPMLAGAAMTLSITSVMVNSLALRKWNPAPHATPQTGVAGSFPVGSGNPVKA